MDNPDTGELNAPSRYEYETVIQFAADKYHEFEDWKRNNPELVRQHINRYLGHLAMLSSGAKASERQLLTEEVRYFSIVNLGELMTPSQERQATAMVEDMRKNISQHYDIGRITDRKYGDIRIFKDLLERAYPEVAGTPEVDWFDGRVNNLYRILPEFVVQDGGVGKSVKTMLGVIAIASFDSLGQSAEARRARMIGSVKPGYYFGATYPLVDDVLFDSDYVSGGDKDKYHQAIRDGLRRGKSIDTASLPDHALTEEMSRVYDGILADFPFHKNRVMYSAIETMYLSQRDDSRIVPQDIRRSEDLYPLVFTKAGMSRIVANMFAGRDMAQRTADRLLSTILRNQFFDDMRDFQEDLAGNRYTPYTLAIKYPKMPIGNPLENTFAYEAFVANTMYGGTESARAADSLARAGTYFITSMMKDGGEEFCAMARQFYDGPFADGMAKVIAAARELPKTSLQNLSIRTDQRLRDRVNQVASNRDPQIVDPRTYLSDHTQEISDLLSREFSGDQPIENVIRYVIEGGKRVRPGLSLMLAESLGIDKGKLAPVLLYAEMIHASSLVFDDLPAQDNAKLRRGKPAAHIRFPEYEAQLAGVAMVGHGIGVLGRLAKDFPADCVAKVVEYVGTELGERICLGQHMDLLSKPDADLDQILDTYQLKTSTTIEGSLVPVMMLAGRSQAEVDLIKKYAYHAGLVFQIQDDILDRTSSSDAIGKDVGADAGKRNVVSLVGLGGARRIMNEHRQAALAACRQLDFPTGLLQNLVNYFGDRKR